MGKFLSSHSDIDGLPVYPLLSKLKSKIIYIKEVLKSNYNDCEAIRAKTGNAPSARVSEDPIIPQIVPKLLIAINLIKLSENFISKMAMHFTASNPEFHVGNKF